MSHDGRWSAYICNTVDVGEHSGCGYVGSGAVAFDHHGILAVTLGGNEDHVVAPFEIVEWVGCIDFAQPH